MVACTLERLAKALTAPPPPVAAAGGVAQSTAQPGAHASLVTLLAWLRVVLLSVLEATLIDEKRYFFEFMSENHAKLKDDQLPAIGLFKTYKSRIPKIAAPCRVS